MCGCPRLLRAKSCTVFGYSGKSKELGLQGNEGEVKIMG
jgi:hypothetical protein